MKIFPDKDKAFPNPAIPSLCYIKNVVKNPRIIVGDYTYYDDADGADRFDDEMIDLLERLQWWNRQIEEVDRLIPILSDPDLAAAKAAIREYLQ